MPGRCRARRRCHHGAPMTAGHDDLQRAADALAARVPEPLAGARAPRLQLPLVLDARRPRALPRRSTRTAGSAAARTRCGCCRRPRPERARARRAATPALLERAAALEARGRAPTSRRPAADGAATPEHPVAFFCAEFGVHGSLPIYSGGLGVLAGDILKEASDRALPLVAVGLHVPPGLLPPAHRRRRLAARVLGRHRPRARCPPRSSPATTASRSRSPCRSRDARSSRRSGASTSAACRCCLLDADRPENDLDRPLDHVAAVRRRPGRAARAVRAARRRRRARARRARHRARRRAPQRGPRRVRRRSSSRAARQRRLARRRRSRPRARAHGLHHPHAGPGRQRHLPGRRRSPRRSRGIAGDAGRRRRGAHPPRPHAARRRRREPFGVTPVRAAHEPRRQRRQPPPRRGRPRACGSDLWPDRAVDDVPIGHVTNGVHVPTWLGGPMRELLDRHLGDGWLRPRGRPGHLGAGRRHPRRGAVGRAQRAARRSSSTYVRDQERDRPARRATSRAATSRPPPTRSTPTR